jgi:hypothetical protein
VAHRKCFRNFFKVRALAAADPALLIDAAAPVVEHYVTGDLAGRQAPADVPGRCLGDRSRDRTGPPIMMV